MKINYIYTMKFLMILCSFNVLVSMDTNMNKEKIERLRKQWEQQQQHKQQPQQKDQKKRKRENSPQPSQQPESTETNNADKKQKREEKEKEENQIIILTNLNNLIYEIVIKDPNRKQLVETIKKINNEIDKAKNIINFNEQYDSQEITSLLNTLKKNITQFGTIIRPFLQIKDISDKNSTDYTEVEELLETFKIICEKTNTKVVIVPMKYLKMDTSNDLEIAQEEQKRWNEQKPQNQINNEEKITITSITDNKKNQKTYIIKKDVINHQCQLLRNFCQDQGNNITIDDNYTESTITKLFKYMEVAEELESKGSFFRKETIDNIANQLLIECKKQKNVETFLYEEICPLVIAANFYNCPAVYYGASLTLLKMINFGSSPLPFISDSTAITGLVNRITTIYEKLQNKQTNKQTSFFSYFIPEMFKKSSTYEKSARKSFSLLYFFHKNKPLTNDAKDFQFSTEELISSGILNILWPDKHQQTPMDLLCKEGFDLENFLLNEYPDEYSSLIMQLPDSSAIKKRAKDIIKKTILNALNDPNPWLEKITNQSFKKFIIQEIVKEVKKSEEKYKSMVSQKVNLQNMPYNYKLLLSIIALNQCSKTPKIGELFKKHVNETKPFDPTTNQFFTVALTGAFSYIFLENSGKKALKVNFSNNHALKNSHEMLTILITLIEPIFEIPIMELYLNTLNLTEIPLPVFNLNLSLLAIVGNQLNDEIKNQIKNFKNIILPNVLKIKLNEWD